MELAERPTASEPRRYDSFCNVAATATGLVSASKTGDSVIGVRLVVIVELVDHRSHASSHVDAMIGIADGGVIRLPGAHDANADKSGSALGGRWDVLVDVEQVVRVVALLDLRQPVVIAAVRRPDPLLTLVFHHHVDVGAASRCGVQLFPIPA